MHVYDVEKLAVAARAVADFCKSHGHEVVGCQIQTPVKRGYEYECAVIARIVVDGRYETVAHGFNQDKLEFSWADKP